MLTGKLVRVRHFRDRLTPTYIAVDDANWLEVAGHLLEVFRGLPGRTRGEVEDEVLETIGDNPTQLVHQGLAKLLEDRCEFEVDSKLEPDAVRERAFLLSAAARKRGDFEREAILEQVATETASTVADIDRSLFADLKSEQRLMSFADCTAEQLLQRYNVALAQALLLRSTGVTVRVTSESTARYRRLFRAIKFHRLICTIRPSGPDEYTLHLDGPLSLFSSTQKYGTQLANFLPTLIQCQRFELTATVRWGVERKEKTFTLTEGGGLKSHTVDYGDYVPKELQMFAESFRKSVAAWQLSTEPEVVSLPSGAWVPDFTLTHKASKKVVHLEILGFWRRTDAEKLYRRLAAEHKGAFILAVSDQLNIDESLEESWGDNVYRFKRTPLPAEIVKLAAKQIAS